MVTVLHLLSLSTNLMSLGVPHSYPTVLILGPDVSRGSETTTWQEERDRREKKSNMWIKDEIANRCPSLNLYELFPTLITSASNSFGTFSFCLMLVMFRICTLELKVINWVCAGSRGVSETNLTVCEPGVTWCDDLKYRGVWDAWIAKVWICFINLILLPSSLLSLALTFFSGFADWNTTGWRLNMTSSTSWSLSWMSSLGTTLGTA